MLFELYEIAEQVRNDEMCSEFTRFRLNLVGSKLVSVFSFLRYILFFCIATKEKNIQQQNNIYYVKNKYPLSGIFIK